MFRLSTIFKTVAESSAVKVPFRLKFTPDTSKFPTLREEDLKEEFMRGSGPGGQSVAKTNNCVQLKHIPTGIVVRCHESRSVDQNRKTARIRLLTRLDNVLNGEDSVEAQIRRENRRKKDLNDAIRKEKLEKKRQFKEREGLTKKELE
ncbi:probable peptide chain release factor C12orf65 homolog, mitochondrial [Thrips palmi]|uniref:Probable peptide chain release factor C12orf65 homolog, mitochondrial n=1 Tax=Thrips palmi TaxID=161013 RepID=A0A6P9AI49_THRPL|nr:probable peptide chain release factor C12orf65 homolog, mitochondrial [Thrips palmi]